MKKSIGVAIPLALVLLAFLGFIACEKGPANLANTSSTGQESPEDDWDKKNGADPCKASNKLVALQTKYHNKNVDTSDDNLNAQRRNNHYDIVIEPDSTWGIVMRIKGRIGRDDRPRKLSKLMQFIEKDLEKGCIQKVSFESMAAASGFEWTICEDPTRPCPPPNGECGMCMIPKETPPTTNSNVNANAPANPNPGNSGANSTNANGSNSNAGRNSGP